MGKRVVVGMSGGVDSSVAALLLKNQGYDVIGVTMQIWQDETPSCQSENGGCCGLSAVEDARRVAEALGIPYYVMNFKRDFQERVIDYFVDEYLRGHTPNPCIACNRYVKWEALLNRSLEIGADYIATGHYARIDKLDNGRFAVRNSVTAGKDQTYALYSLTQEQLAHTLFPVGSYSKDEIRQMAQEAGLPVAHKPDSQEICFVPDDDYAGFIEREVARRGKDFCLEEMEEQIALKNREEAHLGGKLAGMNSGRFSGRLPGPGNFVTRDGRVLGRHKGITHYTIGQRRGLELPMGKRVFVTEIRPETNEVVIGDNEELFTTEVLCDRLNFMAVDDLDTPRRVIAKIRYNHRGEYCEIEKLSDGKVICHFEKPVRAATPGQAVVFYEGEYVLGGGTIL